MNQNNKDILQLQHLAKIQIVKEKFKAVNDIVPSDIKNSFSKFEVFLNLLEEMITLSISYDIPDDLAQMVVNSYSLFANTIQLCLNYDVQKHIPEVGINLNKELETVSQSLSNPFQHSSNANGKQNSSLIFLSIISLIKGYKLNNVNDLEILKRDIELKLENVTKLDIQVRATAQQVITQQYAKIFEEQARDHSYFKFSLKDFKIGSANLWLGFGLLMVFGGLLYVTSVHTYDYLLNPFWGFEWENIDYPLIANRIIFLVLWLGIVKFSFKQYSIHSHLYVVNKHRQNVMNSFKLLHDSLIDSNKESDRELQKILALEVARVIFESGQTGFVQTPDLDVQSPDILEIIKALKSKTLD